MLGMHRSGTSAATRLVNLLGLATCDDADLVGGRWNPTGYWESHTLVRLDDALLGEMGCAWWSPPPSGDSYFEAAGLIATKTADAAQVFRRVHREQPWVWKDPRACLLLPFWREALDAHPVAILIVRNPVEVAESVERRHELSMKFGVALWERYNRLALDHAGGMPVLISRYEDLLADPAGWCRQTREFLAGMGLQTHEAPAEAVRQFVNPALRHTIRTRRDVAGRAPEALATFDVLESLVGAHPCLRSPDLAPEPPAVATELSRVTAGQLIRPRRPAQEGHEGVRRRRTWALMRRLGQHVRRAS